MEVSNHGSSRIGKSSKGTTTGAYTLHTSCLGLIKSITQPYQAVLLEHRHHREGAAAIVLHIGYKHISVDAPHEYHRSSLLLPH